MLTQRDDNRVQYPCFFYSKPLLLVEKHYYTLEQEFLAIIQAIQEWRHYINRAQQHHSLDQPCQTIKTNDQMVYDTQCS